MRDTEWIECLIRDFDMVGIANAERFSAVVAPEHSDRERLKRDGVFKLYEAIKDFS